MSGFKIISPGLLTTVQDLGRSGWRRHGVTAGGAMDLLALRLVNLLVGNGEGAAALEITLTGPRLTFAEETLFALGGGDFAAQLNGQPVPLWRPVRAPRDTTLELAECRRGCRAYLTVAGGIAVGEVMGGRGTDLRAGLGGFQGRALRAGDELKTGAPAERAARILQTLQTQTVARWGVAADALPAYAAKATVRAVRGGQFDWFAEESRRRLFAAAYRVSAKADRMGMRLAGPVLNRLAPRELLSEAVAFGAIQVPPSGQPIVLMADCQTIGGYPKIAHVISVDLPVLAQLQPADEVRFREVSLEEAQRLYLVREREIQKIKTGLALRCP